MTGNPLDPAEDPALVVYVPGAPVGWQRAGKGWYTQPKTRAKEAEIATLAKVALIGRQPFSGAVRVDVTAWMPVPESWSKRKKALALGGSIRPTAKPDVDNILKLVMDALNGVAWKDDAAVVHVVGTKRFGNPAQTVISVEAA